MTTAALHPFSRAAAHASLVAEYHSDVETIINLYPGQIANRASYLRKAVGSEVVRLRRDVRTKMGLHFRAGDLVLRLADTYEGSSYVSLWSHAHIVAVSVHRYAVEAV